MIFKCDPIELIYSFRTLLVEIVYIEIELKVHIIQIIANDFNGFNNFCFCNVCYLLFVILSFSATLVRSYG